MKSYLSYSSIVEAITGLGLLIAPSKVVLLLLEMELNGSLEIILAMIAGAAIFSLALNCWLSRADAAAPVAIKTLLFYNFAVAAILLYGALGLEFKGPALWLVIIFHFFQTVMGILIINKKSKTH
jgi:hypothetical protein